MKIIVVTNNYYLYRGVEASLAGLANYQVSLVSPDQAIKSPSIKNAGSKDIIFLISGGTNFNFSFLQTVCKSHAKVIYAKNEIDFPFSTTFDFIVIKERFFLSDILLAINTRCSKSRIVKLPNITKMEKIILFYSLRGTTVSNMARYLSINSKTVYQHQHNALAKVGVRKSCQLSELPKNLIDYLYLKDHV